MSSESVLIKAVANNNYNLVIDLIEDGCDMHAKNDLAFRMACQNGNIELVKLFVEYGIDVCRTDNLAIREACDKGHMNVVKYLMESDRVNDINLLNNNLMCYATSNGHLELAKYLVEKGVNIHTSKSCPLRVASENGHLELVKYLVGIHDNMPCALYGAIKKKQNDIIKYLVDEKINVEITDVMFENVLKDDKNKLSFMVFFVEIMINSGWNKSDMLNVISKYGNVELAKYMVDDKGADILDKSLSIAAYNGHIDMVKYLYENGVRSPTAVNDSILEASMNSNSVEIVKYLFEKCPDIYIDGKRGAIYDESNNGAIFTASCARGTDVIRFIFEKILESGVDYDYTDNILRAFWTDYCEVIKMFYDGGVRVDEIYVANKYSIRHLSLDIIEMLLSMGVDQTYVYTKIDFNCSNNYTNERIKCLIENYNLDIHLHDDICFRKACKYTSSGRIGIEFVKYLVEKGANIHARRDEAICSAVCVGNIELVKYLVETCGVNIHVRRDCPVRTASETNNLELVKYLIEKGADIHARNDDAMYRVLGNIYVDETEKDKSVAYYLFEKYKDIYIKNRKIVLKSMCKYNYIAEYFVINYESDDIHYNKDELFIEAMKYNNRIIDILMEKYGNYYAKNKRIIMKVARCGDVELMKRLIDYGADIHIQNDRALDEVLIKYNEYHYRHNDMIKYLVKVHGMSSDKLSYNIKVKIGLPTIWSIKPDKLPPFRETSECPISGVDFSEVDNRKLGCSKCLNVFSQECLEKWLKTGNNNCPMCRAMGVFYLA